MPDTVDYNLKSPDQPHASEDFLRSLPVRFEYDATVQLWTAFAIKTSVLGHGDTPDAARRMFLERAKDRYMELTVEEDALGVVELRELEFFRACKNA